MQKLLEMDRRLLIGIPIVAIVLFLAGFGIGRASTSGTASAATATANTSAESSSGTDSGSPGSTAEGGTVATITGDAAAALPPSADVPEGGIPAYGTDEERDALVTGLAEAGIVGGTREGLLATADHVCYTLERLQAQGRSPAFAVRVVWNESLLELDSQDLAAFAAVFSAAPYYVCPDSIDYGEDVAYWLGY